MIHAYSKLYLEEAQRKLACMIDYAVNNLSYDITNFFNMFIESKIASYFEAGDPSIIAGKSGIELANVVIEICENKVIDSNLYKPNFSRTKEYWTGYVISYYQWYTSFRFKEIIDILPVDKICLMYHPYHEMDITQFVEYLNELYLKKYPNTKLKQQRIKCGLSQSELSRLAEIPLRTIQQYEQRQKLISNANVSYLIKLAKVLNCTIIDLIDKI